MERCFGAICEPDPVVVAPVIDPSEGDLFIGSHTKFVLQPLGNAFQPELGVVRDAHRR